MTSSGLDTIGNPLTVFPILYGDYENPSRRQQTSISKINQCMLWQYIIIITCYFTDKQNFALYVLSCNRRHEGTKIIRSQINHLYIREMLLHLSPNAIIAFSRSALLMYPWATSILQPMLSPRLKFRL